MLGVRPAATRMWLPSIASSPVGVASRIRTPSPDRPSAARGREGPRAEADRDALVAQDREEFGAHVGVLAACKLRPGLDDRDGSPEAAEGLRHLETDVAAAEHDEVLWHAVKFERLDVGEWCRLAKAGHVRDRGVGAEVEDDTVGGEDARAAGVEADRDGSRRREAAHAHDQLGAARSELVEVEPDEAVDHVALAGPHCGHVDGGGAGHAAEARGVADEVGHLGAPDLVFARQAVGVGA